MRRCTWSTLPLHCMRAAEGAAHCCEDVSQSIQIRSDRARSLPRSPHADPGCDVGPDVRCVRAGFNDALHALQDAHTAGEKVSDTEVQRRVSPSPRPPRRGSGCAGSPRSCCASIERRSACRCATAGIPAVAAGRMSTLGISPQSVEGQTLGPQRPDYRRQCVPCLGIRQVHQDRVARPGTGGH